MIHLLQEIVIIVDSAAKFVKDIGTKNNVVSTVFIKQVCSLCINGNNAIELRKR